MSCTKYETDTALMGRANIIFGEKMTQDCIAGSRKLLKGEDLKEIREWDNFVSFGTTRETRDGGQLLVLACRKGRYIPDIAQKVGLLGTDTQFVYDLMLMPCQSNEKKGQAPKGNYERALEKLLKGLPLDGEMEQDV